jgi:hypothetical protein
MGFPIHWHTSIKVNNSPYGIELNEGFISINTKLQGRERIIIHREPMHTNPQSTDTFTCLINPNIIHKQNQTKIIPIDQSIYKPS